MSYSVTVRGASPAPREEVEEYLAKLPDVRLGAGVFLYTDEEEDVSVEIRTIGEGENVDRLDVTVPVAVSGETAERVTTFCDGLAHRFGWRIQDRITGAPMSDSDLRRRFSGESVKTGGCLSALSLSAVLFVFIISRL